MIAGSCLDLRGVLTGQLPVIAELNLTLASIMCAGEKEEKHKALTPAYSTQGAAAADGRDLEDGRRERDSTTSQSEQQDQPSELQNFGQGSNGPDMKTVSLSQVDAMTLRDFEVRTTAHDLCLDLQLRRQKCRLSAKAAAARSNSHHWPG